MGEIANNKQVKIEKTGLSRAIYFSICATIVWTTLIYGTVHQPIITIFYIVVALIGVFWALDGIRSGYIRFDPSLIQLPFGLAIVWGIVQIIPFGSANPVAGLNGIPNTISYDPFSTKVVVMHFVALLVFLSVSLTYIDNRKRLHRVVQLITVFGFAYSFYAILQLVLSPTKIYGLYSSEYAAPFGSFVSRHNFAAYIEMALAVPLGLLFSSSIRNDNRLLYLTSMVLMCIALLLSGSRGGLVGAVAGVSLLAIITRGKSGSRNLIVKLAAGILILAAVIGGTLFVGGESTLNRVAESGNTKDVTANRLKIWDVSTEIIKDNLLFGVGLGGFGVAYSGHDPASGLERVEQAHNDYLEVVADAGIPGALIGLFFLFLLVKSGIESTRLKERYLRGVASGAFAGCFAVLVHSLFDFVLHTTAVTLLFLLMIALMRICIRLDRNVATRQKREVPSATVTPITQSSLS